jgi:hypothetical protein
MVHTFKQRLFTTMAMVRHKKESISNGVSRESSTSEENKHKKTNTRKQTLWRMDANVA